MRYKAIAVIGVIAIIFGIVFQLQGRGEIGPESSFMYQNKNWVDYGIIIIVAGIAILGSGLFLSRR